SLRDRVTFVSGIDDTELACLLSSAQIAVIPSLYEGFSLPAVEAMATGTPLVASRAGALPEVVGEDGAGRLVPPGDAEALSAAAAAGGVARRAGQPRRPRPRERAAVAACPAPLHGRGGAGGPGPPLRLRHRGRPTHPDGPLRPGLVVPRDPTVNACPPRT